MPRRVLYFIAGSSPTDEERAAAEAIGTRMLRNASVESSFVEKCDAVAGCAPESYAKFPRADVPAAVTADEPAPMSEPVPADFKPRPRGRPRKQ